MGNTESTPAAGANPSRSQKGGVHPRGNDGHESPGAKRSASRNTPPASSQLSTTTSNPTPPSSATERSSSRPRSATSASAPVTMGNNESKQSHPPSRSSALHTPPPAGEPRQPSSSLSQAVDIPTPSSHDAALDSDDPIPITSPFGLPASTFTNPPRLPLPIERDPEASSPILGPQDTPPMGTGDYEEGTDLPKRASLISSSTLDDEEGSDIQQFAMATDPFAPKVQTTITWQEGGRHVYVTGTFASWEKKFRMHKGKDGIFRATIPLTPGTHHLTFLVDGDPKTSMELPTTVDFANALVNYVEVIFPESTPNEKQTAQAMPIPGAVAREGTDGPGIPPVDDQPIPTAPGVVDDDLAGIQATGTPLPTQQSSSLRPHSLPREALPSQETPTQRPQQQQAREGQQKPALKQVIPRPKYTSEIPTILLHLDLYNTPNDQRFRVASKACQHLPQPPSLPMFMSKSILNANTPQKDDASVLTMPNHTVLNHLATSSIRQGVLATSGTTRYKRKFLTTIMYKPTSDSG